MKCWNCKRESPKGARVCVHCEASLEDVPSAEEIRAVKEARKQLPPEALEEMRKLAMGADSADEFANQIMVGDCPKCGGSNTGDCDKDPEIENILVGRCYDCGQYWCTDCGRLLKRTALHCPCWDEDTDDI